MRLAQPGWSTAHFRSPPRVTAWVVVRVVRRRRIGPSRANFPVRDSRQNWRKSTSGPVFRGGESQRFWDTRGDSGRRCDRSRRGFWDTLLTGAAWMWALLSGHEALEFLLRPVAAVVSPARVGSDPLSMLPFTWSSMSPAPATVHPGLSPSSASRPPLPSRDSKSRGAYAPCGFDPHLRHHFH